MGKNYVENSLKHFLKRKVKITLGFVVAFMISGTVGFAENYESIAKNKKIAQEWLYGNGELTLSKEITIRKSGNSEDIIIKSDNNGGIIIKSNSTEINIKKDLLSYNTGIVIQNALNLTLGEDIASSDGIQGYEDGFNLKNKGIVTEDDKTITISGAGNVHINDKYLENKTQTANNGAIIVNKSIIATNGGNQRGQQINSSIGYNYGIIKVGEKFHDWSGYNAQAITGTGVGNNYGIILGSSGSGQGIVKNEDVIGANGIANNYGLILVGIDNGQKIESTGDCNIKGTLNNYGLIIANNRIGQSIENGTGNNYGTIANFLGIGQALLNGVANNYGIIKNNYGKDNAGGDTQLGFLGGQKFSAANSGQGKPNNPTWERWTEDFNGELNNYNLIANGGNYGQLLKILESYNGNLDTRKIKGYAYNYGIITNTGVGGQTIINEKEDKSKLELKTYNYGVIANETGNNIEISGTHATGEAYNNGIIFNNSDNGEVFSNAGDGKIYNNGVVILKKNGVSTNVNVNGLEDKGIEINATDKNNIFISKLGTDALVATNQNDNIVTSEKDFKGGKLAENTNLFVDRYTNNKLTEQLKISNTELKGNHITTVVSSTDNGSNTVIKGMNDLILDNSSIVGYFEKNGTLLEVNGDLTLKNGSVINAIAGDSSIDDVVAVSLKNDGKLEVNGNSNVLGAIKGNGVLVLTDFQERRDFNDDVKELDIKTTIEKGTNTTLNKIKVNEKVVISGEKTSKDNTKIVFGNNVNIAEGIIFDEVYGEKLGADITLGDGQIESDSTINIDSVSLGSGQDILTIQNVLGEVGTIDGGDESDTVVLKNMNGNHDTFDYALKNVETLDLSGETWKIGANASINDFGNTGTTTKANNDKITIQNGTLMGELKGDKNTGASFGNSTAVDSVLGNSTFGDNAKFQMGIGKDMVLEAGAEYNIEDTLKNNLANNVGEDKITSSGIFTHAKDDTDKELRVKTAEEMGINGRYSEIYNQMLENADKEEVRDVLNSVNSSDIADIINSKGAMADTLATSGYKITRDISNSFISSVNEWNKKANKGEWLANAKYINSDVEYDGANSVKGYDSDITSMVGMIEYGVSDNTSYGVALGGGDTEVDVTGAGTLEGDNYYIGAYAKHSVNGFDLVGNLGYTISDLEVDGNGSADSSAITFAGYVKRDIRLSETIKIEPNLAFTYDYIMQDDAEGNGVKVENKDIHVFEATAGMNIVKEFALNNGNLELKAGIKYSMADINRNEETIMVSVLSMENTSLGNPEVDKTRGTAHIGFDYEHVTGFGINGKYETMWSDKGDDSRITVGISYRF